MSALAIRGRVVTRDDTRPQADAVGLSGGRVVALGDRAQVRDALPGARVLDVPGYVLPGFVDSHVHVQWLGRSQAQVDVGGARSVAEVQERLRAAVRGLPDGAGWLEGSCAIPAAELAEGRLPTADELEAAMPGRPLFLDRRGHDALVNRSALRLAGVPDDHDGLLVEHANVELVRRHVPPATEQVRRSWITAGARELIRAGVTRATDPAVPPEEFAVWAMTACRGEVPLPIELMPLGGAGHLPEAVLGTAVNALRDAPDCLSLGPTKLFLDGGGSLGTALRSRPWPGTDSWGVQTTPTATLQAYAMHARSTGRGLGVHAVGDAAIDLAIEVLVDAGIATRSHLIHAYLGPSARAMAQCARHGLAVAVQPALLWQAGPDLVARLPEADVASANPLRRWLRAGVRLLGGSDAPGPPVSPLVGIWQARTRALRARVAPSGPPEALDADEALALFAPDPITVGAPADLVVLDTDPLHPDPDAVREAKVLATVVGGRLHEH